MQNPQMVKELIIRILIGINFIRLSPHLLILLVHPKSQIVKSDIKRWCEWKGYIFKGWYSFLKLMILFPEFRNIYYSRIGLISNLLKFICPPLSSLYICTKEIGQYFRIQHGFSTIIAAKSIGDNVCISQQVTIGYGNGGNPIIGNNVSVGAGAIIIGGIRIGNNSKIGAGVVITKNVEDNSIIVGGPAYILRRNGTKIEKELLM